MQRSEATETLSLGILDIGEAQERAYDWLLRHSGATVPEIAQAQSLTLSKTRRLLDSIEAKGLVTRTPERSPRYIPAAPDIALEAMVLQRQEELQHVKGRIRELQNALTNQETGQRKEIVELITTREAERQIFDDMVRTSRHEIFSLTRPPMLVSRLALPIEQEHPAQREALARGVCIRDIVSADFLALPGAVIRIFDAIQKGEEIRTFFSLPLKMMLADRRLALIALNPERMESPSLLVRSSALLDALHALFELLWAQAAPISFTRERRVKTGAPPSLLGEEAEKLMSLLAAGLSDKRIASQTGVSSATLTRRMSGIMKAFHAQTRFQLGWLAHKRLTDNLLDKS
jgi:sugar-specific transcriptional regulator TrmB